MVCEMCIEFSIDEAEVVVCVYDEVFKVDVDDGGIMFMPAIHRGAE